MAVFSVVTPGSWFSPNYNQGDRTHHEKNSCPCLASNLGRPAHSQYTDRDILTTMVRRMRKNLEMR
jgi:hypothetical protein